MIDDLMPDYTDDDFEEAVVLIEVSRRLNGRSAIDRRTILRVLRGHVDNSANELPRIGGYPKEFLLDLINKRKELRDATNNTLKQSDAGQADSTPS
jgi:hypothetical protein